MARVVARLASGEHAIRIGPAQIEVPTLREDVPPRALLCGVRPEHLRLDDASALRAEVLGTEYLGTTQIVTITTAHGLVKARLPSTVKAAAGDPVGLEFRPDRISLFDARSGRAIRTALYDHAQSLEHAHV